MKKSLVLLLFFLSFAFDVIFFDYDLSDIRTVKEDVSEISKKIDASLELIFPFYFESLGFKIKNCEQVYNYEPVATNIFEENALLEIKEKCELKKIIKKAKISKSDFIKDKRLDSLKYWDKKLYFDYNCEKIKIGNLEEYKNYNNGDDLEREGIITIISSDDKSIVFINNKLNRTFFVKEILKANFNSDKTKDVLLKISVSDENNSYIKCINYVVFTRENDNSLFVEKDIEL